MAPTDPHFREPAKVLPTGLTNDVYDLVLVLQQAAADAVRYAAFADDARDADDHELATWFDELAASDRDIVARASQMLVPRLASTIEAGDRAEASRDQARTTP